MNKNKIVFMLIKKNNTKIKTIKKLWILLGITRELSICDFGFIINKTMPKNKSIRKENTPACFWGYPSNVDSKKFNKTIKS